MKKALALVLAVAMSLSLVACGGAASSTPASQPASQPADSTPAAPAPTSIRVVTTYAGTDSNAQNYKDAVAAWEKATGNTVEDATATSNEEFKAQVLADFETGSEPDVLFFSNGADSNSFIEGTPKVVSIDEIRSVYPDYASNMKDDMLGASPVDGKNYSVPVNGFWEGLFVNKDVLEACGVAVPDANTTWDQFMEMCETIKGKGYTPIAASLGEIPHYWFEFCIYNFLTPATHNVLPTKDAGNVQHQAWIDGIGDIKALYEAGYLPKNTTSAKDDEMFALFTGGKAAFWLDGSWKVNGVAAACGADADNNIPADEEQLSHFTVTYVPGKNNRKTTDIIAGLSSGYFITQKAWADPDKQAAAVSFVQFMTSDEQVAKFCEASGNLTTALKAGVKVDDSKLNSLQKAGLEMSNGATGTAGAVQDQFQGETRNPVFVPGMANIVTGKADIAASVDEVIDLIAAAQG